MSISRTPEEQAASDALTARIAAMQSRMKASMKDDESTRYAFIVPATDDYDSLVVGPFATLEDALEFGKGRPVAMLWHYDAWQTWTNREANR